MNYSIIPQKTFLRELKRLSKKYRSLKTDLQRLQDELSFNPTIGTDLGRGVRKVRMAIGSKNKGKSHGARVITFTYQLDEENGVINLLYIYDKSERESLTTAEIDKLLNDIVW
jgi:mRNA-degrading endonuclease RelE of RelBE toxin-antitoxin system